MGAYIVYHMWICADIEVTIRADLLLAISVYKSDCEGTIYA